MLQAGATALTIGDLTDLKVTVYIPETQYGQISLGQNTTLVTNSFPGESFHASVTRIADQAEYTPQNVQTEEGRQTTVYAVELSLDKSDGKLKPGISVDKVIANEVEIYGSHGIQAHRYGTVFEMILSGKLAPDKLIGRRVTLEEGIQELVTMDQFKGTGIAVIDRFS